VRPSSATILQILESCQNKLTHAGLASYVEPRMNANGRELWAQRSPSSSSSLVPVLEFPLLPISENEDEDEGRGRRREIVIRLSSSRSVPFSFVGSLVDKAPDKARQSVSDQ